MFTCCNCEGLTATQSLPIGPRCKQQRNYTALWKLQASLGNEAPRASLRWSDWMGIRLSGEWETCKSYLLPTLSRYLPPPPPRSFLRLFASPKFQTISLPTNLIFSIVLKYILTPHPLVAIPVCGIITVKKKKNCDLVVIFGLVLMLSLPWFKQETPPWIRACFDSGQDETAPSRLGNILTTLSGQNIPS